MSDNQKYTDAVVSFALTAEQRELLATMDNPHISLQNGSVGYLSSTCLEISVIDVPDCEEVHRYSIDYDGVYSAEKVENIGFWQRVPDNLRP